MKRLEFTCAALACASVFALAALSAPAVGQSGSGPQCMSGNTREGPQRSFTFYVVPASVATLEARGFAQAVCQEASNPLPKFRTNTCEAAAKAPPSFKQGFERVHGISLQELCNLATQVG